MDPASEEIVTVQRFKADLKAFAKKLDVDLSTVRRKVTLDLTKKITLRTPVLTGRLRSSWAVSDGAPSAYVAPEGTNAAPRIEATFSDPAQASYIVNNLPYATRIEFGGHSKQAPSGMVRISLAEIDAEIRSTMERLD